MLFSDLDLSPNRIEQAKRRLAGKFIDLTSSNPTHQGMIFPAGILRAAADGYWDARRYDPDPRGLPGAREAIAQYYKSRGAAVSPDNIFITASTSEAYSLLFSLLAAPGDNILGPDVTYPLFEHLAAIHGVELRPYALDETRNWQINPASIAHACDENTRAMLVVSPHNPTGAVARNIATPSPIPLVIDEVFAEFACAAPRPPALFNLAQPVFTLNGISKMFALPDLKLGWMALNDAAMAEFGERLELLNDTFLGANSLTQHMLPALFAQGMGFVDEMTARTNANLRMAAHMLAAHPRVRVNLPDGGYYLFPQILGWDDDEALALHLLERGALVSPGYFFNHAGSVRVMISCLTKPDILRKGLEIFLSAI
ncbi:MAG TPA: pyridoxal phosphate-dependent aminotransferase [Thermoflexales bacterium]|nr:pyridoxal phosphate-dependent aminotransferase [Thermoflexales bacterium]